MVRAISSRFWVTGNSSGKSGRGRASKRCARRATERSMRARNSSGTAAARSRDSARSSAGRSTLMQASSNSAAALGRLDTEDNFLARADKTARIIAQPPLQSRECIAVSNTASRASRHTWAPYAFLSVGRWRRARCMAALVARPQAQPVVSDAAAGHTRGESDRRLSGRRGGCILQPAPVGCRPRRGCW